MRIYCIHPYIVRSLLSAAMNISSLCFLLVKCRLSCCHWSQTHLEYIHSKRCENCFKDWLVVSGWTWTVGPLSGQQNVPVFWKLIGPSGRHSKNKHLLPRRPVVLKTHSLLVNLLTYRNRFIWVQLKMNHWPRCVQLLEKHLHKTTDRWHLTGEKIRKEKKHEAF